MACYWKSGLENNGSRNGQDFPELLRGLGRGGGGEEKGLISMGPDNLYEHSGIRYLEQLRPVVKLNNIKYCS